MVREVEVSAERPNIEDATRPRTGNYVKQTQFSGSRNRVNCFPQSALRAIRLKGGPGKQTQFPTPTIIASARLCCRPPVAVALPDGYGLVLMTDFATIPTSIGWASLRGRSVEGMEQ